MNNKPNAILALLLAYLDNIKLDTQAIANHSEKIYPLSVANTKPAFPRNKKSSTE